MNITAGNTIVNADSLNIYKVLADEVVATVAGDVVCFWALGDGEAILLQAIKSGKSGLSAEQIIEQSFKG